MRRLAVRLELWRGDELMLGKTTRPDRPVVVGPGPSASIPTRALEHDLPLLCRPPRTEGYTLRLAAPACGTIGVGGRTLRVRDGLLHDPRPEPLLLRDGDRGELELGDGLRLRFAVVDIERRFRTLNPMDWRLGSALAATATLALVGVAIVLTAGPPPHSPARRGPRLISVRPALLGTPEPRPRAARRRRPAATSAAGTAAGRRTHKRPAGARLARRQRSAALTGTDRRAHGRLLAALDRLGGATRGGTLTGLRPPGPASVLDGLDRSLGLGVPGRRPRRARLALAAPTRRPGKALEEDKTGRTGPSREEIAAVVARGRGKIQHCYERRLLVSGKQLEGRIMARWLVGARGRAEAIRIASDSVGSAAVRRCVVEAIRRWRFPAASPAVAVVYPFEFFTNS